MKARASRSSWWDFMDGKPKINQFNDHASVPASKPLSSNIHGHVWRAAANSWAPPIVMIHGRVSILSRSGDPAWSRPIGHLLLCTKAARTTAYAPPESK